VKRATITVLASTRALDWSKLNGGDAPCPSTLISSRARNGAGADRAHQQTNESAAALNQEASNGTMAKAGHDTRLRGTAHLGADRRPIGEDFEEIGLPWLQRRGPSEGELSLAEYLAEFAR
jgi:hypothetical protein